MYHTRNNCITNGIHQYTTNDPMNCQWLTEELNRLEAVRNELPDVLRQVRHATSWATAAHQNSEIQSRLIDLLFAVQSITERLGMYKEEAN